MKAYRTAFVCSLFPALLSALSPLLTGCQSDSKQPQAPIELSWRMDSLDTRRGGYVNTFVVKNCSSAPLQEGWSIYYCQLPRGIEVADSLPATVQTVNGNYFRIVPTTHYRPLAPGDSLCLSFRCAGSLERYTHLPEGAYWVGSDGTPIDLTLKSTPLPASIASRYPDAGRVYAFNATLPPAPSLQQTDIIPTVKQAVSGEGSICLERGVSIIAPEQFKSEASLLQEQLTTLYGIRVSDTAPVAISLEQLPPEQLSRQHPEAYRIYISNARACISASTPHGIFNGTQTLLAMLKGTERPYTLQGADISDYPDMDYRGVMIDIVRNFTTLDNLKRMIDLLASYKMNTLQFHFNDDEGWRLEIPGLPELTEVGGRRGHTTDERDRLYPGYAGGSNPRPGSLGNGYYTRKEFIDLLRYAAARHVHIIPEMETPGHARAAIVSMKARYDKYLSTNPAKALEYMLVHPEDTSHYLSVQHYSDNVLDVALPSTYRFIAKVVSELQAMYREAGLEMTSFHLGGDEVAEGAWSGSPACHELQRKRGMSRSDLPEYYITRAAHVLDSLGVKFNGWQEVAMGHRPEAHRQLTAQAAGVNCWTAVPDWGTDGVVYEIANSGYPVVLSNVCNFYMDMAYSYHPAEPGLDWGGCVDEVRSFSALPFRNYRSCRHSLSGHPLDLSQAEEDKPILSDLGRRMMIGVSAQFFAETLRGAEWMEYHFFPKYMGVAERGWHTHPSWEALEGEAEEQAFLREVSLYEQKIGRREIPHWAGRGVNFHVPFPGLMLSDGLLHANVILPGAEIRYTLDGTTPTLRSPLWTAPVPCRASCVKAKAFYKGKESVCITLRSE
ncbi:MAG: family 20 glycosylhydrolase [Bacteroides sp.]|nr:family 20 glycosylhydrolase [Bacteroides sp.]